jgi:DNA-binding MarR family transcriptional regulator
MPNVGTVASTKAKAKVTVAAVGRDDDLAAAWHDLMGSYHRITCVLDRELLARHDVTLSEFEVLQQLHDGECGAVKMSELGERVHLTQSALSRLVARLERDGLVSRAMCQEDRRSVFAQITAEGAKRYEQARPTQRAILREQSADMCIRQTAANFSGR